MINNNGTKIEYNSFNKPSKIITKSDTVEFTYDTNKQRYKKDTNKYTSYYLGKTYEQTIHTDGTKEDKYFIYAGNKVISIYTNKRQLGVLDPSTKYLHYDSLNSVDTITNNLGVVEARMAYKPFGEKLNLDKDGKTTQKAPHTNRGYTGHEHIEETNLIHMNARLYDPTIARFLSADTIIQDMYDTQAFNRYTYVRNNPLKYTDPSGHSWLSKGLKKAGKWMEDNKYQIGGAVLMVVGFIGLTVGLPFGGIYWGPMALSLGASMIKYDPNEPESQTNQISVSTGSSGITVAEWGGESSSQNTNTNAIVSTVSGGTSSSVTGGKTGNGGLTVTYTHMVDPTYQRNEDLYVATQLNVDASSVSANANIQSIYGDNNDDFRYIYDTVMSYYTPAVRIGFFGYYGAKAGFGIGMKYGKTPQATLAGTVFGFAGGLTLGALAEGIITIPLSGRAVWGQVSFLAVDVLDIDLEEYARRIAE